MTATATLRALDDDTFCELTEAGSTLPAGVTREDVWAEADRRDAEWVMPANFDMAAQVDALLAQS